MSDFKRWLRNVNPMYQLLALVVFIIVAYHGFQYYVDWRIDRKIHEDKYLREIANTLRPFVIFNETNSILIDEGAMRYIEKIRVIHGEISGLRLPERIIVTPKESLRRDPVLSCLNDTMDIIQKRGEGFDYIYELKHPILLATEDTVDITRNFKLEILR